MEKIYIAPEMHVHDLKTIQMVCASGDDPNIDENTTGDGPGTAQAKSSLWSFDEEED